ncbi:MAG: response regulator [Polyangiaceae bacterium]|jgi:FixJ family two-component response regulator
MTREAVVLVVDDTAQVRVALGDVLRSAGYLVELFGSAQAVLDRAMPEGPHCLVLDVHMPEVSGLDLQARLVEKRIGTPIVFITGHGDIPMSVHAMKAGAFEFLTKPFRDDQLLYAVERAIEQSAARQQDAASLNRLQERYARLTTRQREVMLLVTNGMLNKEVAVEMGITEVMIKVHRRQVMAKMLAGTLPDLVRMADRLGLRIKT